MRGRMTPKLRSGGYQPPGPARKSGEFPGATDGDVLV